MRKMLCLALVMAIALCASAIPALADSSATFCGVSLTNKDKKDFIKQMSALLNQEKINLDNTAYPYELFGYPVSVTPMGEAKEFMVNVALFPDAVTDMSRADATKLLIDFYEGLSAEYGLPTHQFMAVGPAMDMDEPDYQAWRDGLTVQQMPFADGKADPDALGAMLDGEQSVLLDAFFDTAMLYVSFNPTGDGDTYSVDFAASYTYNDQYEVLKKINHPLIALFEAGEALNANP